jgi:hypothetical protein
MADAAAPTGVKLPGSRLRQRSGMTPEEAAYPFARERYDREIQKEYLSA